LESGKRLPACIKWIEPQRKVGVMGNNNGSLFFGSRLCHTFDVARDEDETETEAKQTQ